MKTINYLIMVSAAILGVACNDIVESADVISIPEKEIILTATREHLDAGTKSFRLDDGSVWWSPKEDVSVFYGSGTNGGSKFSTMNTSIAETVELQGSVQMSGSAKDFWAVYPYSEDNSCDGTSVTTVIPSCQTGVEGNFSNDVFPAVAKSSTMNLAFWNICGGIKFFVSRGDIKYVTFKGNNDEPLAGKVKVTFGPDGTPVISEVLDPRTEVKLTAPEGGTFKVGKYYYITLLPTGLQGGFTMSFRTENEKGTLVSTTPQIIKRSTFGVLKNIDSKVQEWKSNVVEPEYVDLGLSVKWATFNVGATKPEEYGDYFAWGETEPYYSSQDPLTWKDGKTSGYDWPSYKFELGAGWEGPFSKYVTNSKYGTVDNKTVLDPEDDAAHVNWGGSWRMPTDAEWTELRDNCTWTWATEDGVSGRKVTGPNGKSIFLPAAGDQYVTNLYDAGAHGLYWSSSLYTGNPNDACIVYFDSGGVGRGDDFRFYGFSVRPVYGEFIPVSSISLDKSSMKMNYGETQRLTSTVSPFNATARAVHWASSDKSVVYVDADGLVAAVGEGTATVTACGSSGVSATCAVSVYAPDLSLPASVEAIDLGLPSGLKWATMNVGARRPEGYGAWFAWGETAQKSDYSWSTYKFELGTNISGPFSKYVTNSNFNFGTVDNKTVLDPEDDAAHVNWGGSWRMPTVEECEELINKCTWSWTTQNGVSGRLVTGSNGKSIFLPAAGYRYDTYLYNAGSYGDGYYWSSSLYTDVPDLACFVDFNSGRVGRHSNGRYEGFSVRPVYGEFIPVASISLDRTSLELNVNDTYQLTATISPSNATAKDIRWVSSDTDVATVDADGLVIAVGKGSATITAYGSSGVSASCIVTVEAPAPPINHFAGTKWGFIDGPVTWTFTFTDSEVIFDYRNTVSDTPTKVQYRDPYTYTETTVSFTLHVWSGIAFVLTGTLNGSSLVFDDTGTQNMDFTMYPFTDVTSITLNQTSINLGIGESRTLIATVTPANATYKTVIWRTSDDNVATVSSGVVTAVAEGTCTITAMAGDKTATCTVTVTQPGSGPEAVDLGLSVKWASFNLGATKPEDYGEYFAWGETQPKENYIWSTYKWCNGDYNKLTKYCTYSSCWDSSEPMYNKTVLDPEDDAAHVNWGGSWRMPTREEWGELIDNCTWTWTSQNGVNGRLVTGPNGKSIFLPAAGYRYDTYLYRAGSSGFYWSSSLTTGNPNDAYYVFFDSDNVFWNFDTRCNGFSVRPVTE